MSPFVTAFVGLGGNLGDARATLKSAVAALRVLPRSQLARLSSLYRSAPLGPPGQPDYLNAVARLETSLPPHALLAALQDIESRHGRVRAERWGARSLDLDLLLYGSDSIATHDLTMPHPELMKRNFVVVPLLEISPEILLPDGTSLASLAVARDHNDLNVLAAGSHWAD